jgi:hypothetical protein
LLDIDHPRRQIIPALHGQIDDPLKSYRLSK